MRLINAKTLQLEEFADEASLEYAILSHRWEDDEVTFTDMQSLDVARRKRGFNKIARCCEEALRHGCAHAWVDTCCIDKRSSSELSEAINSMFRWYSKAQICLAYLSDVGIDGPEILTQFKSSQWFTRGWTLQELLAPAKVLFYNSAWLRIGSKHRLIKELVEASGIAEGALMDTRSIFEYSVAQRMHWASKRRTTRLEDRAYSLMGLFNVNMAMLYGEGEKAFMRLQEEIIKHSDDPSIFAWTGVKAGGSGLLASTLNSFADPTKITSSRPISTNTEQQPWTMTNQGLYIELSLTPWSGGIHMAVLDCQPEATEMQHVKFVVGIFLQRIRGRQFRRILTDFGDILVEPNSQILCQFRNFQKLAVYVRQDELSSQVHSSALPASLPVYGVKLLPIPGIDIASCLTTSGNFNPTSGIVELEPGQYGPVASLDLFSSSKSLGVIRIGLDFDFRPRVAMARDSAATFRSQTITDPNLIQTIWDVGFNHPTVWDTECFSTNPYPARDRSEGAIDDVLVENIFVYGVSESKDSSLIYVMHRPRNGGQRVLVAELDISRTAVRSRKLWTIGITLFPAGGASPQESANVIDMWKPADEIVDNANASQGFYSHLRQYVGRFT